MMNLILSKHRQVADGVPAVFSKQADNINFQAGNFQKQADNFEKQPQNFPAEVAEWQLKS